MLTWFIATTKMASGRWQVAGGRWQVAVDILSAAL
jgi:hypothetical protein